MYATSDRILKTFLLFMIFHYCNAAQPSSSSSITKPLVRNTHLLNHRYSRSADTIEETSSSSSTCHHCFDSGTVFPSGRMFIERCGGDNCVPLVNSISSTADSQPTKNYDFSQCGMIDNSYAIRNKALQLKISTSIKNTLRPGEYPWLVRIESRSNIFFHTAVILCGATLIHPQWVITAAHCLFDSETNRLYPATGVSLYIGHYNRSSTSRDEYVTKPSLYLIHPRFRIPRTSPAPIHDLAMIKLAQPVRLSRSVGVACLPDRADTLTDGTLAYTAGWGRASSYSTAVDVPRKARIKIASKSCRQLMINRDLHVCGRNDRGSNICSGDSGSGLMARAGVRSSRGQIDWKWHVFGVASYGLADCSQNVNHDNAFSSVSHDLDWIHEVMKNY